MKKNIIKSVVAFLCFATFSSCSIDDVQPFYQLTAENVVRDETSAQLVLNGIYSGWKTIELNAFPLHLEALGTVGNFTGIINGSTGFNTNQVLPENVYISNLYNAHYKIINSANFLIQELEAGKAVGISEKAKAEIIAQAKFNRAMAYFNVLRYFGEYFDEGSQFGMVIRTTFSENLEFDSRSSVAATYSLILSDLEYSMDNGPEYVEHFYAGKVAATALLARVQLYRGDYTAAATLAGMVIDNAEGYELEENYKDIFSKTYNSSESIFAIYHSPRPAGGSGMYQINSTKYSNTFKDLADEQVAGVGSLTGAGSGFDPRFEFGYSDATKGINKMGKYPTSENIGSSVGSTLFYIRLAEMYLIRAEAIVRSNGDLTAALEDVNTLRLRAGVAEKALSTKAALLEDIRHEKMLELYFENGESWFDLIRYHKAGDLSVFVEKPSITSTKQFILPIGLNVLTANNLMIQNPGY